MIHTDKKILSLSTALLLCFTTLALAAPPPGKGGGKGNQSIDGFACFDGEIMSNTLLQGAFIDNGNFDTLAGQLATGDTITVSGDAGDGLVVLDSLHSILPNGASYDSCPTANCFVTFDVDSGAIWTIRLDRDKEPEDRVQFKMKWVNEAGLEHHLRIGWVVQAYDGEKYPLDPDDYGASTSSSLESAAITFNSDLFRIEGDIEVPGKGKKTKTELEVFSRYNEQYHTDDAPWCGMGGMAVPPTCRESTTIQTDLGAFACNL